MHPNDTMCEINFVLLCFSCWKYDSYIFLIYFYIKKGYKIKGMEKFVLKQKSSTENGYLAVVYPDLTGKRGVTTTPLRPSGFGIIDDKKYDLYSDEGFIPSDTKIEVIKVESMKIYVRRI